MKNTGKRRPAGDAKPLCQTVFEALRGRIAAGEWKVGQSLLSETEVIETHKVSRITARHALRLLENDGYIRKNA